MKRSIAKHIASILLPVQYLRFRLNTEFGVVPDINELSADWNAGS